ncbi:hypothetical protein OCU04_012656 [Sclerotinia nivalis]|uniref:Uncharacterized protein n=1 Tax=Sclerotinia nivalis TaxID=352851 RepID=A0A9X0ACT6_9HELO|nr:hypothetical protein OCU04_012656 [Sclerotinia nivalis]
MNNGNNIRLRKEPEDEDPQAQLRCISEIDEIFEGVFESLNSDAASLSELVFDDPPILIQETPINKQSPCSSN